MNELTIKTIDGEIFTSKDTVRVIGRPRPLSQEHINKELPAGLTVAELIDLACGERRSTFPVDYAAYIDGTPIPTTMQDRVRLKPGRTLTFEPRLASGDTARNIALIAVAVLALVVSTVVFGPAGFFASSAILGSTIFAGLVGAGIVVAGSLAVNALFPLAPQATPLSTARAGSETVYSITGAQNSADPWGPIPSILGRVRVYPRYASLPFTTFQGEDQYLRLLFVIGYGPLALSELRIGETLISTFDDITWQSFEGYETDASPSIYTNQAFEESLSVDLSDHDGTWFTRTTESDIDEVSGDFAAPQGWFKVNSDGKHLAIKLHVTVEYRISGSADPWVTIYERNEDIKKNHPWRFGFSETVTRGPAYDVRVKSTSATPDPDDFQVANALSWITFRSFRNDPPISFDKPLALVAIKIKATGQLNSIIDSFNCVAESRVNSFDGANWDAESSPPTWDASRNPADLIRHVLQGPAIYSPVSDEQLDLTSIEAFWQYCDDEGWEYNREHSFRGSVFDTIQTIAASGRGRVVRTDGKWGVIWDEANIPVAQHFSHRNSWGFEEGRVYFNAPHAYRCPFVNEQKGWAADERFVYADGYTAANATVFESIEFPGVTDPDKIWRLGRFHMAQTLLRPGTYTLTTNWQALSCTIGSRVYANHDVAEWGLAAGRVTAVEADVIEIDEEVALELGVNYLLRFRQSDGTSVIRTVLVTSVGATKTLTLASSALPDPVVGDLVMFGEDLQGPAVLLRVRDIEWLPDLTARLTLVDDAPDIASADTGPIPPYDSQITEPSNFFQRAPYNVQLVGQTYLVGQVPKIRANISWSALALEVTGFEIQMRNDSHTVPIYEPLAIVGPEVLSITDEDVDEGIYSVRVRSLFGPKAWSRWVEKTAVPLTFDYTPPADVTNFRITSLGDVALLSWDAVQAPNISHYVIRQTAATVGVTWGTAAILFDNVTSLSIPSPPLNGTFLIKAFDNNGLESINPATIISTLANINAFNVVQTLTPSTDSPPWPGILTDLTVDGTDLLLSGTNSPPSGMYEYNDIIDLGDIYTSRLGTQVVAFGDNTANFMASWLTLSSVLTLSGALDSDWAIRIEERHTSDDPAGSPVVWSDWTELVKTDITARAFDFRLFVYTFNPDVDVRVSQADITIDMPDRQEAIGDIAVAASSSPPTTVTFSVPFKFLTTVLVSAIQDAQSGDYPIISNRTTTGFDIVVYDSTDTPVARTVDAVAFGYGKATA